MAAVMTAEAGGGSFCNWRGETRESARVAIWMQVRMSLGGSHEPKAEAEAATRHARLRRRLRRCLPHFHTDKTRAAQAEELREGEETAARDDMKQTRTHTAEMVHSWSDTEDLSPVSMKRASISRRCVRGRERESLASGASPHSVRSSPPSLCSAASSSSVSSSKSSASSTSRKGVTYSQDGALVSCRFCEILREGEEPFLYEDEDVVVFRPLAPVVASHLLVVPRRHIRNVNQLTPDDAALLQRMRDVAALVLREMPRTSSKSAKSSASDSKDEEEDAETDFKFAFHTPPFNSIDHVHMHAFRVNDGRFGCVGSIKYRTETWWCRSFDEVMTRLGLSGDNGTISKRRHGSVDAPAIGNRASVGDVGTRGKQTRRHHASHPPSCGEMHSTASTALTSMERFSEETRVVA